MTEAAAPGRLLRSLNCDGKRALGLLAAVLALLLPLLGGEALRQALRYERAAIAAGQWWRFLTAHVVHLDARHALLNSAGLALLWALFARIATPREWLLVLLTAVSVIGAGFWWLEPQLAWYVGASGVLHGVFAAGCIAMLRARDRLAWVAIAIFVGKLAWEYWQGPLPLEGSAPVITAAHRYGAMGGAVGALLLGLGRVPRVDRLY